MSKHNKTDLAQMQSLPLSAKVRMTERRIKDWYEHWYGEVFVSFSGGKDSTVLLDIARQLYPDIEAVFVDTGLEYPEIRRFVKTFDNVTILRPQMRFDEVIKTYGYPVISKEVAKTISASRRLGENSKYGKACLSRLNGTHTMKDGNKSLYNCAKYKPLLDVDFNISQMCCDVMKKKPSHEYIKRTGRKPITAQMASESRLRETQWIKNGCNGFEMKSPISNPMSFWTEQDVLHYIKQNNLPIASVYGEVVYAEEPDQLRFECEGLNMFETEKLQTTGCKRTGCIFCGYGCHLEKEPSRFQLLKETHPRQYEYCLEGGEYDENGIWKPNEKGLGMKHIFEELNKIYGGDFIKYE